MCKQLLRSVLVALILTMSLDAGMAAKRPPRYVVCETAVEEINPLRIEVLHGEKVKDAVEHCLSFWNGVVLDIER